MTRLSFRLTLAVSVFLVTAGTSLADGYTAAVARGEGSGAEHAKPNPGALRAALPPVLLALAVCDEPLRTVLVISVPEAAPAPHPHPSP